MVYGVWWIFDTDIFPPSSLLTFPHHGGTLSWWEYAGLNHGYDVDNDDDDDRRRRGWR